MILSANRFRSERKNLSGSEKSISYSKNFKKFMKILPKNLRNYDT